MKYRPVLLNHDQVNAILSGRKTQQRFLVPEWQIPSKASDGSEFISIASKHKRYGFGVFGDTEKSCMDNYLSDYSCCCPFGKKGDRLWVRETFSLRERGCHPRYWFWADGNPFYGNWSKPKASIHMPKEACRIIIEITKARVEQVQSISESDACAEGHDNSKTEAAIAAGWYEKPIPAFRRAWEQRGLDWDSNPWVWVIEFNVITTTNDMVF